jgi:hypothetical protein
MDDSPETRQGLSDRIEEKQSALRSYLERLRPRRHKLTEFSVVGSVLAANSQAMAEKVTAAETAIAQLEGLQLSLGFGHIATDEAAMLYKQFVSHVSFVGEVPSR